MPFFMTQGLGAFNDNIFKNALAALLVFQGSKLAGLTLTNWSISARWFSFCPFSCFPPCSVNLPISTKSPFRFAG